MYDGSPWRDSVRRLSTAGALLVSLAVLIGLVAIAGPAASAPRRAQAAGATPRSDTVSVVKVSGRLDPVLADFVDTAIDDAVRQGRVALVLQLNSKGALISDKRLIALAKKIHEAPMPVVVWVGPSGASALGRSAQLAGAASRMGIAPGSRLGDTGPLVVPEAYLQPAFLAAKDKLEHGTVGSTEAKKLGIAPKDAPVIGQLIIDIPGVHSKVVTKGGKTSREPTTTPVFSALPITSQLLHTVCSPEVAYLLFVIGMALILFELFTAGVGVAGLVGAGFFAMGCYGLAVLPARGWAVGLLVFSMLAYAVDVQTGVPRVWTGIATFCFIVGSFTLYDGLSQSWITLLVGIVGMTLAMVAGMPAMVRTRFSTPTIGREWMVGEEGEAVADVDPDGVVRVREALWRARTNRATPIGAGAGIRVVGIEGLLLEVEPREGGARDHRERARKT
jgi:membrane-bound serine protease (ClpP class)